MGSEGDYDEAVNWLYDLQYFGMKLGLDNTRALLRELGDPHTSFKSVHVAGTNGKGSVCAFLTSILMDAGLKVGTYTSPHLADFGERICVDNIPMTRPEVLQAVAHVRPKVEALAGKGVQCTFFETTTCMAFRHFARRKVDAAVVEVGMGGRLDSTNVITPELSVITNISREHTQHLGETLAEIAGEKAGILKPKVPAVSSVPEPEPRAVIRARASELKAPLHETGELVSVRILGSDAMGTALELVTPKNKYNNIRIKLAGGHQAGNAATAVLAAELLSEGAFPICRENIERGMASTRWAGRLQVVRRRPTVILDATHNPGGAETLAAYLRAHFSREPPVLVIAMLADKEVGPVVRAVEPLVSSAVVTQASYHRAMKAADLAALFKGSPEAIPSIPGAVDRAMALAGESGTVLITGSIYSAAEALAHLDALRSVEMLDILASMHDDGAYPGGKPGSGPPPPGSQEPFRVLISTILSQRTRDENTHAASAALFSKFGTAEELADAPAKQVEALVRRTGFYKQKAANIIEVSRQLRDRFGSEVPADLAELTSLPGVGRKTANCVLAYGFGIPAIAVDTHVHRMSNLIGLVRTAEPEDTELALSLVVPKERWLDVNRLMVRHGQTVCAPAKPRCGECPIAHLCDKGIYG